MQEITNNKRGFTFSIPICSPGHRQFSLENTMCSCVAVTCFVIYNPYSYNQKSIWGNSESWCTFISMHYIRQLHVMSNSHYHDVIISATASQITSVTIVYLIACTGADRRKYQSSASLAFMWGIHRSLVNSPHKGPVTRKPLPFDDVIMILTLSVLSSGQTERTRSVPLNWYPCIWCRLVINCYDIDLWKINEYLPPRGF